LRQLTCSTEAPRRTDNNNPVSEPAWFKVRYSRAPVGSVEIKSFILVLRGTPITLLQCGPRDQSLCGNRLGEGRGLSLPGLLTTKATRPSCFACLSNEFLSPRMERSLSPCRFVL